MSNTAPPNYFLEDYELRRLEGRLIDETLSRTGNFEIVFAWIRPDRDVANVIRSYEVRAFPEVAGDSKFDENQQVMLAQIENRDGWKRIVRAATLCGEFGIERSSSILSRQITSTTGFICVDQLIELANFTKEEFFQYYHAQGIDTQKCISVETHFNIEARVSRWGGLTAAELMYFCMFNAVRKIGGGALHESVVFATINEPQAASFRRIGLKFEPLMGRTDLVTPEKLLGRESNPVAIFYNEDAERLFSLLETPIHECLI